jgi:AcrR family transcriptional regulator
VSRAAPLPPDARRASIISATIPLLRTHGRAVTTAQIAMAAGVAEGTLFRVFPDKDALIDAAVRVAFDPGAIEAQLAAIDRAQPLRDALVAVVEILQHRVSQIWQLMTVLGLADPRHRGPGDRTPSDDAPNVKAIFAAHRDEIRCDPAHATRLLRIVTFAGTHPRITDNLPLTPGEIVTIVLDGIRARDDEEP